MRFFSLTISALAWLHAPVFSQTPTGGSATAGTGAGMSSQAGNQANAGNFGPTGGLGFGSGSPSLQGNVKGGSGAGTTYPTQTNPFRTYFANPLGVGMSGTNTASATVPKAAFGQPLFGAVSSTAAAAAAATDQSGTGGTGFSTVGMYKAPAYVTSLADDIPLIQHPPAQLTRDLRQVLQRSTSLKEKEHIALTVDGQVVTLRGQVANDRERRLAESLIRLTPGVVDVQNELTVRP